MQCVGRSRDIHEICTYISELCIRSYPAFDSEIISERRRRCEVRESGSCTYCIARGLRCTLGRLTGHTAAEDVGLSPPDENLTWSSTVQREGMGSSHPTSRSLCAELVKLYFDYVHDQFHSLFHQPSFEKEMARGEAPRILLYGMMALSAR